MAASALGGMPLPKRMNCFKFQLGAIIGGRRRQAVLSSHAFGETKMIARLSLVAIVSGLTMVTLTPAFAARQMTRNEVVTQCVSKAQTQAPSRGDDTSVQQRRMALYSSCMRANGLRP